MAPYFVQCLILNDLQEGRLAAQIATVLWLLCMAVRLVALGVGKLVKRAREVA